MSVSASNRFRALVLAAACAASLGIAACGGDDDESSTTTPVADTTGESGSTTDTEGVASDVREQFNDAVRGSLETAAASGSPIDADCAVDRLETELSDEDVQAVIDAVQNGEQPPGTVTEALTNVATECVEQ
jgi:ABC-type phosphate transport system substrate-binding protein